MAEPGRTAARWTAALAAALATLGAVPAAAVAGFSGTTRVASAVQLNSAPDAVAVDDHGTTTVVWDETPSPGASAVKARRVTAAGAAGPVMPLSPAGEDSLAGVVASTAGGRSFAAWRELATPGAPTSVKGRWIEANGALGPVLTIVSSSPTLDAVNLGVAVASSGTATVTWINQSSGMGSKLGARRIDAAGSMGAIVPDMSGGGGVTSPRIVALSDGSTLATWRNAVIETAVLPPDGTPAVAPTKISTTSGFGGNPSIAIDGSGSSLVAWRLDDGATPDRYGIFARKVNAFGEPAGPEITIEPMATAFATDASAATDSHGDFLASWTRDDGANARVEERRLGQAAHTISPAGFSAAEDSPAVLDDGSAAVAWVLSTSATDRSVEGREVDAAGVPFGPTTTLVAGGGSPGGASNPKAGVATTLSFASASGNAGLFVNRFLARPRCSSPHATVVQGRPILVHLGCTGPGVDGARVTTAPRHGTAAPAPAGAVRYAPRPGYAGADSFGFEALNDGGASAAATAHISVGKDTVRPRITRARFKRHRHRIELRFSERATARVRFFRRHGGKLVATLTSRRLRTATTLAVPRKLRSRRLRATVAARDAAGNHSRRRRL